MTNKWILDESVFDCLSCCIDHSNIIINNKVCISTIVKRAKEKNCKLSSYQTILILNQMQYLKHAYLFMLQKQSSGTNFTFASACKKAIEHMKLCNDVSTINNFKILLKLNRTFFWMRFFFIQTSIYKLVKLTYLNLSKLFLRFRS